MQKTTLLCVMAVLCLLGNIHLTKLQAQNTAIQPLTIGDAVPDIEFTNMVNYHQPTARLSDFKGKLVILDFWATWCGPCVRGLPKMDSLQQKFKSDIQVISLSTEDTNVVNKFLQKKNFKHCAFGANTPLIQQLFPAVIIPHLVVINKKGVVEAITHAAFVDEAMVTASLKNQPLQLPVKKDLFEKDQQSQENYGFNAENIKYRSTFTGYKEGLSTSSGPVKSADGKLIGFRYTNAPIIFMYLLSLKVNGLQYKSSRVHFENITHPEKFILPENKKNKELFFWKKENIYTYEVIAPNYSMDVYYKFMQADLDKIMATMFNAKAGLEEKICDCRVLKKINRYSNTLIHTSVDNDSTLKFETHYAYYGTRQLATYLEILLKVPVINETMISNNNLYQISKDLIKKYRENGDAAPLQKVLKSWGLELVPAKRPIKILVIRGL